MGNDYPCSGLGDLIYNTPEGLEIFPAYGIKPTVPAPPGGDLCIETPISKKASGFFIVPGQARKPFEEHKN